MQKLTFSLPLHKVRRPMCTLHNTKYAHPKFYKRKPKTYKQHEKQQMHKALILQSSIRSTYNMVLHLKAPDTRICFRTYYVTRQSSSSSVAGPCSVQLAGARGRRWNSACRRESRETITSTIGQLVSMCSNNIQQL